MKGWFREVSHPSASSEPFGAVNSMVKSEQSFQIHKQLGTYGKFLVPVHVGKFA